MSPREDYDDLDALETSDEPSYVFKLGGREWHCRQPRDVHWDTVETFLKAQAAGGAVQIATRVDGFLSAVVFPEEVEDLLELKRDPAGPLTVDRATVLIRRITERVLNRPTTPPSASSAGRPKRAGTSGGASRSRATKGRAA